MGKYSDITNSPAGGGQRGRGRLPDAAIPRRHKLLRRHRTVRMKHLDVCRDCANLVLRGQTPRSGSVPERRLAARNVKAVEASLPGRERTEKPRLLIDTLPIIPILLQTPPPGLKPETGTSIRPVRSLLDHEYFKTFGGSSRDNQSAAVLKALPEKLPPYQRSRLNDEF